MAGEKAKLSRWQIASFSMMAIPISALGLPFAVHLPAFYKNELGISATAVGLIVMMARFWDVITDPIFGAISDQKPSRWGRRRHWIVLAVPLQMFCAYFLFIPPAGADAVYLGVWLFLIYVTSTIIVISHASWGAELSPFYHDRTRVQGYREFALIGGMLLVLLLPVLLGAENRAETVWMMGIFIIVAAPLCAFISIMGTPKEQIHQTAQAHFNVKTVFQFFLQNPTVMRILATALFIDISVGITAALYVDTITHVFGLGAYQNLLLLVYFLAAVAAVPFWIWISRISNKHRAFSIAMIYGAAILLLAFLAIRGSFWVMVIGLILYGIAYGAGPFLLRAIMADFADIEELESGVKRTGLCFSLINMANKLGLALAIGLVFPLLDLIDFQDNANNSPETIEWLLFIYVIPSVFFFLLSAAMMWNYPIDQKRQEEIQIQLDAKKAKP